MSAAGKEAVSEAVSKAYDDNLDLALALGWAYVDALTFDVFNEELSSAPKEARPALDQLAILYGLTRVELGLASYLASDAVTPKQASHLRSLSIDFKM